MIIPQKENKEIKEKTDDHNAELLTTTISGIATYLIINYMGQMNDLQA